MLCCYFVSEAVRRDEGNGGAEPGAVQSDEPQLHAHGPEHGILWAQQEGNIPHQARNGSSH